MKVIYWLFGILIAIGTLLISFGATLLAFIGTIISCLGTLSFGGLSLVIIGIFSIVHVVAWVRNR